MIESKYYTEKEGRDPNIYLGIDGHKIPVELFKGIYSEDGVVYTDDPFYGIQFIVTEDEKSVILISRDDNLYITKEDIESTDIWYKIGHVLGEYSSTGFPLETMTQHDFRKGQHEELLRRYNSGQTGLMKLEEKRYNAKGEYMRIYSSFDTRPNPKDSDIRGNLLRHINFLYGGEIILWQERDMEVRTNSRNITELYELLIKPQLDMMRDNDMLPVGTDDEKIKFTSVMSPSFGKMEFIEDDSIEDFLVVRKDK